MLLYFLDLLGVAVFAISGALSAGQKNFDVFGVYVVATVTAIGGGSLRDVLLDRHPLAWIQDANYLWTIGLASLLTLLYTRRFTPPQRVLLIADALGVAMFAIMGARIAEHQGLAPLIVIVMGTITGIAGGIMRDLLCAEIPLVLRREIYATAIIAGISAYLIAERLQVDPQLAIGLGMLTIILIRLWAIYFNAHLPSVDWLNRKA
jgi:uncharacterized membrane protein YeiH